MILLFEKLQTQSAYPHRLQQPLSLHGYKEFKFQTSPLGLEALLIPFLN